MVLYHTFYPVPESVFTILLKSAKCLAILLRRIKKILRGYEYYKTGQIE